ncbi:nitroreductase family deazaflavin-dependent oxidoreductase [Mycobacterium sp. SM1]|uniref:nitroreductase family deazaflavin-dependent oxidoreductase n=1 Tax=Mycobacterium sp. SM1 TaxID=2816243 RepID=UPI001F1F7C77|nr:nitroreductase family deazaflavin-dependent oxidoreductase [Mycobacterium sp. SM1]
MRAIARVNKRVTNPILQRWAPRLPYMAVIEHNGRKSGKSYQTPVMAFVEDGKLSVVLDYGTESDWVRNVQAAGSAGVLHRGKHYQLTGPSVIPIDSADLPQAVRVVRASARNALQGTLAPG